MNSLTDFPLAYTQDLKVASSISDEQLQDICSIIRNRIDNITSNKPAISVIFPAYNEEMYLPLMLWTLSKLNTLLPIEIIGVNNNSSDRTGEIIQQSGLVRVDEMKKGVSYARQAGLEVAKGGYIATTDADTHVPFTWIDANMKYFKDNPDLLCFSGGSYWKGIHETYFLFQKILRFLKTEDQKGKSRIWTFPGANSFYRKDAIFQAGGYEKGSDLWEDVILARKIQVLGNVLSVENDHNVRVITSARRSSSFLRTIHVCLEYIQRDGKNGRIQSGKTFSDIR